MNTGGSRMTIADRDMTKGDLYVVVVDVDKGYQTHFKASKE